MSLFLFFFVFSNAAAEGTCAFALKIKDKVLTFKVEGRSAAERRFKQERDRFQQADRSGNIVVEWLFHPFYIPRGHTSLRIGNTIYEFAPGGWKIHDNGANNARAFLFNNPFFKRMYSEHRTREMPPFSIGVPIEVPLSVAHNIDKWIRNYSTDHGRPFSYLLHNCNHCLIEALEVNGAKSFDADAFAGFSSLITMRKLLQQAADQNNFAYIYPLPDIDKNQVSVQMPNYLIEDASYLREFWETIKSVGNFRGLLESYRRVFLNGD